MGLERELGVVVGVGVDDARGHVQTVGVDHLVGVGGVDEADLGDPSVLHGDVTAPAGQAAPVDHDAAHDGQVVGAHVCPSVIADQTIDCSSEYASSP